MKKIREEKLRLLVLECPYDILHDGFAREIFSKMILLKLEGYQMEYPYGIIPVDTTDFVGDHMILCQEWNGKLIPLMAQRTISLQRCQLHHLEFPLFHYTLTEQSQSHRRWIESRLAQAIKQSANITYDSSVTIHPHVRETPDLKNIAKELILAQHVFYHTQRNTTQTLALGVTQFKMDREFQKIGFEYAMLNGEPLNLYLSLSYPLWRSTNLCGTNESSSTQTGWAEFMIRSARGRRDERLPNRSLKKFRLAQKQRSL